MLWIDFGTLPVSHVLLCLVPSLTAVVCLALGTSPMEPAEHATS